MKKKQIKKLKNSAIYIAILVLITLLRAMSRSSAIALMRFMGRLAFKLAVNERKKTIKHLTMAFGSEKTPQEIEKLALQVFLNISTCAADAIRLPVLVKDGTIDKIVKTENYHYLSDEVAKKNGVLIMSGHYANWEVLGTWVVRHGIPVKVVAKKSYDPRLDKLIVDYRNEAGYRIKARGNSLNYVIEGLMRGETFALLFDLDTKVKGVFVDFFGKPAHTATAPVLLANKLNVPIVPLFCRLNPDDTYTIAAFKKLPLVNTGDEEHDVQTNTQICSDFYEKVIRAHPEQWIWMHRRWKKQPGDKKQKK